MTTTRYQFLINNILIKRYNTASANMLRKQLKRARISFNELVEIV